MSWLEWLAQQIGGEIPLYNLTAKGVAIKGFQSIQPKDLKKLV